MAGTPARSSSIPARRGWWCRADLVPDFKPNDKPGSITYVSSGIKAVGYWTDVTVDFTDSTDGNGNKGVASSKVQVLVATEVCDLNTNACDLPLDQIPRMIGIGFDRDGGGRRGASSRRSSTIRSSISRRWTRARCAPATSSRRTASRSG